MTSLDLISHLKLSSHLYEWNIIYLDWKPSNVFLDKKGNVFLGDYGLAADIDKTTNKSKNIINR